MCRDYLPSNVKEPLNTKTKARHIIPRNCRRFLYLCWQRLLHHSWLFYRLASSHPHESRHHHPSADQGTMPVIMPHCYFWHCLVRQRTPVHGQYVPSVFSTVRISTQDSPAPHYPQSDGKVEAMVKSMKKFIRISWTGRSLNHDKFCWAYALLQYRNILSRRDGLSPAQKLYGHPGQDIIPAHCRSFMKELQLKAEAAEQQAHNTLLSSKTYYNQIALPLPDIQVESNVTIHNTRTKLWDIYSIVTHINPHRYYYIKTPSGRVLIRNHHFLLHCVPASIPLNTQHQLTSQQLSTPEQPPSPSWSIRSRHPPKTLIEDPNWIQLYT